MAAAKERWRLLAKACISKPNKNGKANPGDEENQPPVSRAAGSFGFVKSRAIEGVTAENISGEQGKALLAAHPLHHFVSYDVVKPAGQIAEIRLRQRRTGCISLADHQVSQACGVDSTGIVCLWPAEEVLTHYCTQHPELFRGRRVLELGAGYGLAGLAVAACTEASEIVLTDGNPQVMDAIQHNIQLNAHMFGGTAVRAAPLTWGDDASVRAAGGPFDVIIAADCTFFRDYHAQLAGTIKSLLERVNTPGISPMSKVEAEDPVEPQLTASPSHNSDPVAASKRRRDPVVSLGSAPKDEVLQSKRKVATNETQSDEESVELERRLRVESDCLEGLATKRSEDTCQEGEVITQGEQLRSKNNRAYHATTLATEIGEENPSVLPTDDPRENGIESDEPIALLFNPRRGGTLDKFVEVATRAGLRAELSESFDEVLNRKIERLKGGECAEWPGFTEEHCRPIMLILRP